MERRKRYTYVRLHLHDLQPPIGLREEIGRARERDTRRSYETPPKGAILADSFTEGAALFIIRTVSSESINLLEEAYLEVDSESGHLLREAEEVDRGVE